MTADTTPDSAAAARSDARAKRIAAAVARGKVEYTSEYAYTERRWFAEADVAGPSKLDRQRVEYASTYRLAGGASGASDSGGDAAEAARALADIRACAGTKPLRTLPRELIATGARAAILAGDTAAAADFARASSTVWRQSVGSAMAASEALVFAGETAEATHPLLHATTQGIHYPILARLGTLLSALETQCVALAAVVAPLAESRSWAFSRPLFADTSLRAGGVPAGADALRAQLAGIDRAALRKELGIDGGVLEAALGRIARALGGGEEEPEVAEGERVERGVREL